MTNQIETYCRLEIFCAFKLQNKINAPIRKNPDFEWDVFVEKYNNFDSVKHGILQLSEEWTKKYYSTNIFTSQEEDKIYYVDYKTLQNLYRYPVFLIYNRYNELLQVGYCPLGWLSPLQFIAYVNSFYENSYGKEQGKAKLLKIYKSSKEKNIVFLCPDWYPVSPSELIEEETSDLYLKEWLEKGEVSKEYQKIIFQKEIDKRNSLL